MKDNIPLATQDANVVEVDDSGPSVAPSQGSKIVVIVFAAVLISVVLYFFFFKKPAEDPNNPTRNINEIIMEGGERPVVNENDLNALPELDLLNDSMSTDFLQRDKGALMPELPQLPALDPELNKKLQEELMDEISGEAAKKKNQEKYYTQEEVNKMMDEKIKALANAMNNQAQQGGSQGGAPNIVIPNVPNIPGLPNIPGVPSPQDASKNVTTQTQQQQGQTQGSTAQNNTPVPTAPPLPGQTPAAPVQDTPEDLAKLQRNRVLQERAGSPMFKMNGGTGPTESQMKSRDSIMILDGDYKMNIKESTSEVVPTKTTDLSRVILQGKVINAILENSIDTESATPVRAIISRDVYAEFGKNILIPKGSRVIGAYQTGIQRGQTKVIITWSRIIRVDGLSLNISANATDRLGRAGISGDVDNRYAEVLGNSFLASVLSIASSIAVEKVTGTTGIDKLVTSEDGTTVQTTGKASDYAIVEATQDFMDKASDMVDDLAKQNPIIRIPQGTEIVILVNQDLTLPLYSKGK